MKISWQSKEYKRRQRRHWHKFFTIWPRRISETQLVIGFVMRRVSREDRNKYEYRSIEEHARMLLTEQNEHDNDLYKNNRHTL